MEKSVHLLLLAGCLFNVERGVLVLWGPFEPVLERERVLLSTWLLRTLIGRECAY